MAREVNPQPDRPPLTVFISYRRDDAALVDRMAADIEAAGYRCWVDRSVILGGEDWIRSIAQGMGQAAVVIAVVTPQAQRSDWVRAEWALALLQEKQIVPVLPAQCSLPEVFGRLQAVSLYPQEAEGRSCLIAALGALAPAPDVDEVATRTRPGHERAYLHRLQLEVVLHHQIYTPLAGEARLASRAQGGTPTAVRMNPRLDLLRRRLAPGSPPPAQRRQFDDVSEAFEAVTQAVVLGEPGAGKTTTLFKIAGNALPAALAGCAAPLPALARLGLWTDPDEPFLGFLSRRLGGSRDDLHNLLRSSRAILLLDGLNEIPAAQRQRKAGEIRQLLEDHPGLRTLVSCRGLDYQGALELGLDTLTIRPLDAPRILEFLISYLSADLDPEHGTPEERLALGHTRADALFWTLAGGEEVEGTYRVWKRAGADLAMFFSSAEIPRSKPDVYAATTLQQDRIWQEKVRDPRNLVRLARNPYMLAMLVTVYDPDTGALPGNRAALFEAFVEALLAREDLTTNRNGTLVLSEVAKALLAGLDELAWALQTRDRSSADDAGLEEVLTALPRQDAERLMTKPLLARAAGASLLDAGEQVRFTHQLLQEHFAARGLRRRFEAGEMSADRLWPKARWWAPSGWEEVAVLLAGLYPDDCTPVLNWIADANPEVAARAARYSGADVARETLERWRELWTSMLTDVIAHPAPEARAAIGRALAAPLLDGELLDPRVGVAVRPDPASGLMLPVMDWVRIPCGEFLYQDAEQRSLPAFHVARFPITQIQFLCFVDDPDGYGNDRWWRGLAQRPRSPEMAGWSEANHPRETVSWFEAMAFCRWLSARLTGGPGEQVRLPTEWEWEKAARGTDGREYPWGNGYRSGLANINETHRDAGTHRISRTTAVGIYPQGASSRGVADSAGNVWEWCLNKFDTPDDVSTEGDEARVVRGGSWGSGQGSARCASRPHYHPYSRLDLIGFRVVSSSPID